MPYPPRAGKPRDTQVVFRLTDVEVAKVNVAREGKTRSDYLRDLVHRDFEERGIQ